MLLSKLFEANFSAINRVSIAVPAGLRVPA
jgi:hypothetical protein